MPDESSSISFSEEERPPVPTWVIIAIFVTAGILAVAVLTAGLAGFIIVAKTHGDNPNATTTSATAARAKALMVSKQPIPKRLEYFFKEVISGRAFEKMYRVAKNYVTGEKDETTRISKSLRMISDFNNLFNESTHDDSDQSTNKEKSGKISNARSFINNFSQDKTRNSVFKAISNAFSSSRISKSGSGGSSEGQQASHSLGDIVKEFEKAFSSSRTSKSGSGGSSDGQQASHALRDIIKNIEKVSNSSRTSKSGSGGSSDGQQASHSLGDIVKEFLKAKSEINSDVPVSSESGKNLFKANSVIKDVSEQVKEMMKKISNERERHEKAGQPSAYSYEGKKSEKVYETAAKALLNFMTNLIGMAQ